MNLTSVVTPLEGSCVSEEVERVEICQSMTQLSRCGRNRWLAFLLAMEQAMLTNCSLGFVRWVRYFEMLSHFLVGGNYGSWMHSTARSNNIGLMPIQWSMIFNTPII